MYAEHTYSLFNKKYLQLLALILQLLFFLPYETNVLLVSVMLMLNIFILLYRAEVCISTDRA